MEVVAILDAGAQYAKVIDRRVRELNINTEILPMSTPAEELKRFKSIIISGGPESVYTETIKYDAGIFSLGIPILGICFGMQLMVHCRKGKVEKKFQREDGQFKIKVEPKSALFSGMDEIQTVLLTHGDSVVEVGPDFQVIALSGNIISGISCESKKQYGVQFHPEVDLTENGIQVFKNFLFHISGLKGDFTMEDRRTKAIEFIKSKVGDKKVLVLVSGGVDSAVCAALLNEALGSHKVIPLHINNGFMRKEESKKVDIALAAVGLKLINVDSSEQFYKGTTQIEVEKGAKAITTLTLDQTINPEHKRKIIGDTFMRIAQQEIDKLGLKADEVFLAQGTLRPDIIESGSPDISSTAHTIKTHHNDTNLVRELRATGRVVEPLSDYHKDEVRRLGKSLGLPESIVMRQPFPGPGLAVRIICTSEALIDESFEETNTFLDTLVNPPKETNTLETEVDHNLKEYEKSILGELRKENSIHASLLPIKTVGVQGDGRSYNYVCVLSTKNDPNWDHLFMLAKLIPRLKHNINRVVYIFNPHTPAPVKTVTPTVMTKDIIHLLQEVDDIVTEILTSSGALTKLSQVPVILFPVSFGVEGATHSVAIRTIITNDFMTGRPAIPNVDIPAEVLFEISQKVKQIPLIGRVVYDLTTKPPATTEWE